MVSKSLPPRQKFLLTYIETFLAEHGYVPTLVEMAKTLKVSSPQAVKDHLLALECKGYLRPSPGRSRAIELLSARMENAGIPILGKVRAGVPIVAAENWKGTLPFKPPKYDDQAYFALRVTGDNMIGASIFSGDYVIVRKQDTAVPGNVVVALIGDEATVKFLRQHGHEFILEAANPAYASIALTDETSPQCILGRMVGLYCHLGESLAE